MRLHYFNIYDKNVSFDHWFEENFNGKNGKGGILQLVSDVSHWGELWKCNGTFEKMRSLFDCHFSLQPSYPPIII